MEINKKISSIYIKETKSDLREEQGITLIALIITLLILIIISAVSISAIYEARIIDYAVNGSLNYAEAQEEELNQMTGVESKLESIIASIKGEGIPEGTITFTEPKWNENGTATVVINTSEERFTLQYQIDGIEEEKWQDIERGTEIIGLEHGQTVYGRLYDGQNASKEEASVDIQDKTGPIVTVSKGAVTTKSIQVTASSEDRQWGMPDTVQYSYYIKESSAGEYPKEASYTGPDTNYIFDNLKQNTNYDIQITTQDKAGNIGQGELEAVETGTVEGATGGLVTGNIVASNPKWSGGKANITLSTSTGLTIQYQVNGIEEENWETGTSVTGLEHNDTVYARLTDGINYGEEASVDIQDNTSPSAPSIGLDGTVGDNDYYKSNVTVTITAGNDEQSGANQIRYSVSGAQTIGQTTTGEGITSTNIIITADGTSTITAYTLDKAGNVSEEKTQIVNKDATPPSTASIAVSGEPGETSISVTANGQDATSGVASYTFQYSTTSEKEGFTTALEVQNTANSCTYPYQGLTSNTTYYLRVIVKDRAGNTTPSTAINVTTKQSGLSEEVLASNVGAYVDYTPTTGSFTSEGQYGGTGDKFTTDASLKWIIMEANNNTLKLISDKNSDIDFVLAGANGYNNGVLLLNNACKAMYSNSSLGATGRSLNIDDIEKHMNKAPQKIGDEYYPLDRKYPNIFALEKTGAPNGTYGTKYGQSEQTEYVSGRSEGEWGVFKAKGTYYSNSLQYIDMDSEYKKIFGVEGGGWIASRCTMVGSDDIWFMLHYMFDVDIEAGRVYDSGGSSHSVIMGLRPVVEIDLTKVNVGLTGDGGENTPYSITAK